MEKYEQEHLELVRNTAAEGTLFLKKDESFPLAGPCKIAAFGNGIRHTIKGGTGSGEVNSRFSVNVEEGLKDAGFTITSGEWLDAFDGVLAQTHEKFLAKIRKDAEAIGANPVMFAFGMVQPEPEHDLELTGDGDAAIYVLSRNSGEGNDRKPEKGDVLLTDTEVRDILALNKKFDKFMLVLNVGGPVDLSPVMEVRNILLLSQLGVVTGNVLADILLGKANPSGKLATTWAKWEDYSTLGDFGDNDDVHYNEGIYVGYRYFDTQNVTPLFPFGFGKSYTEFTVEPEAVSNNKEEITVSAKVTNTGKVAGKEVVQVYVSCPFGKLDKPTKDLVAFVKTSELGAGQSETVKATFKLSDIASYDEEGQAYILDKGNYVIYVGNCSRDVKKAGAVVLADTVTTMKTRNCLGTPGFKDFVPTSAKEESVEGLTTIELSASDFDTETVTYDVDYPVDDIIAGLSDEELAYINTGAFDPKNSGLQVIGNASFAVAGAAGETTTRYKDKGIKSMVMADGPAGLRLTKEYFEDETGVHGIGSALGSMMELMSDEEKAAIAELAKANAPKPGTEIKEQYATAIPIGTAIAQTFNYDLAYSYGDIVGKEMERFHVQLWLAPALNIHRSILCGRNFEYYSEDPLVAGLFAAAITNGVQKHKGCGTTIKHYAANNAETNRYNNNSHVSERAMREIYLRGFGICVRKSQPKAVMTSYNLLNGQHTSEHRGLIEDILRCEYGFKGIVMTDWVVEMLTVSSKNKHRGALANEVVKAGGDLFMPGTQGDFDRILADIKSGAISRKQIEQNATRVYRMANELS
ncbi:beta-glucosidase [Butyrivibrio sp. ob235]|uniref:glycoside hydrolase family 3 N-terminal domain-containing protein n=1 Tax=Butyrivibrio sp. ob235 TaxID=1761780 RepID=UPI0008D67066|nr:glycoside hydrolase family 3 N-terminal domain-containing protein [Butyrivibrio sp. ob235]SEK26009.1 beta-glucosidase [Butyrivibrio sp. ob235]